MHTTCVAPQPARRLQAPPLLSLALRAAAHNQAARAPHTFHSAHHAAAAAAPILAHAAAALALGVNLGPDLDWNAETGGAWLMICLHIIWLATAALTATWLRTPRRSAPQQQQQQHVAYADLIAAVICALAAALTAGFSCHNVPLGVLGATALALAAAAIPTPAVTPHATAPPRRAHGPIRSVEPSRWVAAALTIAALSPAGAAAVLSHACGVGFLEVPVLAHGAYVHHGALAWVFGSVVFVPFTGCAAALACARTLSTRTLSRRA